jgi:hypothetical protein
MHAPLSLKVPPLSPRLAPPATEAERQVARLSCFAARLDHALARRWTPEAAAARAVTALAVESAQECLGAFAVTPLPADTPLVGGDFLAALLHVALALCEVGQDHRADRLFAYVVEQTSNSAAARALWTLVQRRRGRGGAATPADAAADAGSPADPGEGVLRALAETACSPQRGRRACERVLSTSFDPDERVAAQALLRFIEDGVPCPPV